MISSQTMFTNQYLKLSKEEMDIDEQIVEKYRKIWWHNTRNKAVGGLRLTDAGLKYLIKYDVKLYEITFPSPVKLTAQLLITLDNIIDCPYYISNTALTVTCEQQCTTFMIYLDHIDEYFKQLTNQHKKVRNEAQASRYTRK